MGRQSVSDGPVASRHVYGPVPSRRLGRSLGVDLVPFKTCSYDCIYCQLGRTNHKTTQLAEYVPVDQVLAELEEKLRFERNPDFIGLAGSGEPTLHSRLGDLIEGIKRLSSVPVAVLTNGSLLWMPEVRAGLAGADLVLPSLDAGVGPDFERVNRPHPDVSFDRMVDGLLTFSHEFGRQIWLEAFILAGLTDRPEHVERVAAIAARMRVDRVQLNSVARPPAEACALAVTAPKLEAYCRHFSCPCEVVVERPPNEEIEGSAGGDIEDRIVALVNRRPCTVEGIAAGLALRPNEVLKHLEGLHARQAVRCERRGDAVFYEGTRERPER